MFHASYPQSLLQWLVFRVEGQEYGLDLQQVQEIRAYQQPRRIDGAPAYFNGVLALRGQQVPVVDLRRWLGLVGREYDASTVTVVMRLEHGVVGVVVEGVTGLASLEDGLAQPVPQEAASCVQHHPASQPASHPATQPIAAHFLRATGLHGGRPLPLVDAHKLMNPAGRQWPVCESTEAHS